MGSNKMTQNKYQMSQAYSYTPKSDLRFLAINSDYLELITPNKVRTCDQLRQSLHNIFNAFSHLENNKHESSCDKEINVQQGSESNDVQNKTMRDLEKCANAAREIGVCGQIKWINKTDET